MLVYLPPIPEWQTEREKKNKFLHWLRSNGFLVMAKDGSPGDGKHYKANVDVLMAIDAVELSVEIRPEVVVLVTAMLILHIWLCSCGGVGFVWKWPLPLKRWILD
jgi:uncharacterized LabA/DUF88 family protein